MSNAPLSRGISEPVSGYSKIQGSCNIETHSAGVFKKFKAVPKRKELQDVDVVGLDLARFKFLRRFAQNALSL